MMSVINNFIDIDWRLQMVYYSITTTDYTVNQLLSIWYVLDNFLENYLTW